MSPAWSAAANSAEVRFGGDASRAAAVYAGARPLRPEDIAEAVAWVVGLPAYMNINRLKVMPTCQGPGPMVIKRSPAPAP